MLAVINGRLPAPEDQTMHRIANLAAATLFGLSISAAHSATLTLNINTEITDAFFSGEGLLPLRHGGGTNDYADVLTLIELSESSTLESSGTTSLILDYGDGTGIPSVSLTSAFDFYLDLGLTDVDGTHNFEGMVDGSTVSINATASDNLHVEVSATTSIDGGTLDLTDPFDGTVVSNLVESSNTVTYSLGYDINDDGNINEITFGADGIGLILDSVSFDDVVIDAATGAAIIAGALQAAGGVDAVVDIDATLNGIDADLEFSGSINPPFGPITLSGQVNGGAAVAEPGVLGLLTGGLFGVVAFRGRRRT